jgi:hypothetical protein
MILNSPYISGSSTITGNLNVLGSITGSTNSAISASYALNATSASYALNSTATLSSSYAATSSYADTFTVAGTLTAQKLVVQTITSSIVYSSGSNVFGNSVSNTQSMTGSVGISGSLAVVGAGAFSGNVSLGASYLYMPTAFSGTEVAGSIYKRASDGLVLFGAVGTTNDFTLYNSAGSTVMTVTTGTVNTRLYGALSGSNATFSASTNALNIGNSQNSAIALSTFGKTSTSGYATANNYLQIGAGENATSSTRLIGFGYSITANTNQPAYIGYIETSNTGETKGSLIFGTRDVTTDTAPTTRLTIASTGAATFSSSVSSTEYRLSNLSTLLQVSSYTVLRDNNERNAILIGNSDAPANYYDNSEHYFRNRTGATQYLTIAYTGAATFSSSVTVKGGSTIASLTDWNSLSNTTFTLANPALKLGIGYSSADIPLIQGFDTANQARNICLQPYGGNVGIGTTSPSGILHIAGDGTATNQIRIQHTGTGTNGFLDLSATSTAATIVANYSTTAIPMVFLTGAAERMRITGTPTDRTQVLIGTDAAVYTAAGRTNLTLATPAANSVLLGFKINGSSKGYLFHDGGTFQIVSDGSTDIAMFPNSAVKAGADNAYTMGASGARWSAIWAANGTIQTSDARQKKDITPTKLGLDFIMQLNPVSYKWKNGGNKVETSEAENENEVVKRTLTPISGKRTHYGLIAQEVKEVLGDIDFGGYVHDEETDTMALRYDQFISPLIKAIQEQQAQIEELKAQITELQNK